MNQNKPQVPCGQFRLHSGGMVDATLVIDYHKLHHFVHRAAKTKSKATAGYRPTGRVHWISGFPIEEIEPL